MKRDKNGRFISDKAQKTFLCSDCGVEIDAMGREIKNKKDPFRHNYPKELLEQKTRSQKFAKKWKYTDNWTVPVKIDKSPVVKTIITSSVLTVAPDFEKIYRDGNRRHWIIMITLSILIGIFLGLLII